MCFLVIEKAMVFDEPRHRCGKWKGGRSYGAFFAQCTRNATIWLFGCTRKPFVFFTKNIWLPFFVNPFSVRSKSKLHAQSGLVWCVPDRLGRPTSRFASLLHEVPSPTIRWFRIVSRFGAPLHGEPNPTMRSFRVVSCFTGCPIPELRLCQQHVHRLSHYGCVLLCVLRQCVEPVDACTSHPKKRSLGDRPIYNFHYNIHFSRRRLHCVRPKPPAIA